jgi:hypothetical protein
LLYRGTRDGFRSSDFHGKCDGYANTVTLILSTNGSVFGGFTSVPWASSGGYQADQTPESFLFRVKHPANGDQIVCPISDKQKAISCGGSLGPTFGFGYDLHVANNCHMTTSSYSKLGSSYRNDTGLSSELALAGQCHFKVKEIEVFSIDL